MTLKNLQQYIFYLLIFLIPSNLAKHWPQSWSYVNGILVDYLIPTFYLTDLLIILLLLLWLIEKKVKFQLKNLKNFKKKKRFYWILGFLAYFSINILMAKSQTVTLYKWLKVLEFGLLIIYIKSHPYISKNINKVVKFLSFSVIWQSILAICQWFKQASILGYWFLGEQPFNTSTLAIKKIFFLGKVKVLPMATFTHPNVLAGFLVISLILILNNRMHKNLKILSLLLGSIGLLLTFSYPAILVFLFAIFIYLWQKRNKNSKLLYLYLFFLTTAGLFLLKNQSLVQNYYAASSWSRRGQLNKIAFDMWLSSPVFGVGLGNFIPRMEEFGFVHADYRFLQPVHNVFLLILSQSGLIGISLTIFGLIKTINKKSVLKLVLIIVLLCLASLDHYWLTIQQGILTLSLVLGLNLKQ